MARLLRRGGETEAVNERSDFELLTKDELRRSISYVIGVSILDKATFVRMATPGAKRELMEKWAKDGPLTKLDLQRVLRIIRELDGKHGHD